MAESADLVTRVDGDIESVATPERLPVPIAAMIIVLLSAALWAGIIWAARSLFA